MGVLGAQERRVAVGVGCSPGPDGLLRWAYRQAELPGATVDTLAAATVRCTEVRGRPGNRGARHQPVGPGVRHGRLAT